MSEEKMDSKLPVFRSPSSEMGKVDLGAVGSDDKRPRLNADLEDFSHEAKTLDEEALEDSASLNFEPTAKTASSQLINDEVRTDEAPAAAQQARGAESVSSLRDVEKSSAFGLFFKNLLTLLFRPSHFWEQQRINPTSLLQVHWPHLVILVALRALAQLVGGLLHPYTRWTDVLLQAGTSLLFLFFFVWLFSLIVAGISAVSDAKSSVGDTVRFTAYSVTPLLLISFLAIIPIPQVQPIADIIAMPYTFYVLGAGVSTFLLIPEKKAATLTGLMCGILLCLWALIPLFIPWLISYIFAS